MPQQAFRVGEWVVEPARGLASCQDQSVRLEPKTVELLAYLVTRQGEVVSRAELLDAIWPNVTVGDAVITNKIATLRRVFGDTTKAPNFIETIPKRGYRLVAPVDQDAVDLPARNGPATNGLTAFGFQDNQPPHEERQTRPHASRWPWVIVFVLSLIVICGTWYCRDHWMPQLMAALSVEPMQVGVPSGRSIAVLPFANSVASAQHDDFVDGMRDDLITDLSKMSGLSVVDRTSVFKCKEDPSNIRDLAQELGVRYVLEGSVQRVGDHIWINAKLIDARTGQAVWSERFESDSGDIPDVRGRITANVVSALAVKAGMH